MLGYKFSKDRKMLNLGHQGKVKVRIPVMSLSRIERKNPVKTGTAGQVLSPCSLSSDDKALPLPEVDSCQKLY